MCLELCYLIWHIRCVRIAEQYKLLSQSLRYCYTTNIMPTTTHNKHFLSSFSVPLRTRERKIVNKYIYQSYTNYYYNNNHYIIGNLSCPCVVRVVGVCVPGGSRSLLKLSQSGSCWDVGRRWERCRRRSGTGGYSLLRITAVSVALYFCENNGTSAGQAVILILE